MLRGNYRWNYRWNRQAVDVTVGVGFFELFPASQRRLPRQQSPLRGGGFVSVESEEFSSHSSSASREPIQVVAHRAFGPPREPSELLR